MFRGSFVHAVDPKGRVSVPSRFRDVIVATHDERVVITNFRFEDMPCLEVFPHTAWQRLEENMSLQPQFDPKVQAFTRYYIANAQEAQVDKQGRILLPPSLRSYAKLNDAVTFAGAGAKFQIWDRANWQIVFERSEAAIFGDPQTFFTDFKF